MSLPDEHLPADTLVTIALGDPMESAYAVTHLSGCEQCRGEVSAYQRVMSAVDATSPELTPPPARVWTRVEEATRASAPPRRSRQRSTPRWIPLLAVAAASLALGALGGRALWGAPTDPAPTVMASAALNTLDTQVQEGRAVVERSGAGAMDLAVTTPAFDAADGYLEVWLINADGKRMVSIGVLRPQSGTQTFQIDPKLIDQGYTIVDISREGFDDKPAHSGDSLVRGTLQT